MRRREFITLLGGTAVTWPLPTRAQVERMRRIGVLMGYAESDSAVQTQVSAFRAALAKLGWTEGTISGSKFGGAQVRGVGSAHSQKNWSNCNLTRSSG
ncbi:MAG TPA: hypothetical protein VK653_12655 [Xanthobacteraceae bacterium]|nr:hypothetical protein [Xanthobacteraceae bacterium]